MLVIGIGIYIVIVFIMTALQIEEPPFAVKIFVLSIIFTPIYGVYLLSKEKGLSSKVHYYYCQKCEYIYPVKMRHCPLCEEKGEKVKLIKYENPHKLHLLYKKLNQT